MGSQSSYPVSSMEKSNLLVLLNENAVDQTAYPWQLGKGKGCFVWLELQKKMWKVDGTTSYKIH